jgi:nitrate/nitrite-specific signal transduction histidine kinase
MMRGSLRRKIIAWSFIPALLILASVALVNFRAYSQVTQDLVIQRNRELVRLLASRLSDEVEEYLNLLDRLARTLGVNGQDPAAQQEILNQSQGLLSFFDGGVLVLDNLGQVRAAIPQDSRFRGLDLQNSALYMQDLLRAHEQAVVTDALILETSGSEIVILAAPISNGRGAVLGWVAGLFRLGEMDSSFSSLLAQDRLPQTGIGYLVDGSGLVIFHTQPEEIGRDYSDRDPVVQVLAGKVASLRTRDAQGRDVVMSYAPVTGTRWGLVIVEPWRSVFASSLAYQWFLIGLLALGVLVPAGVVALGVRRITRPVEELTVAAQEVAAGNFGRTIRTDTGDELETLADQFNHMSVQLEESYAILEQRVADRTRELATLNAIASVVSRSLDLQEILVSALEKTIAAMDFEAGAVLLIDVERDELMLILQRGLSPEFAAQVVLLSFGEGAAGESASYRAVVVKRIQDYPDGALRRAVEREGLVLVIGIPLLSKGEMLGVLNLCARYERVIMPEELQMLASIGEQVGVAIENARLYAQAEETARTAERNRLARELHDSVTQNLFAGNLIANVLPRLWERDPQEARRRLEELRRLNRGALAEMRMLLLELRPSALVEAEMGELFRQLAEAFTGRTTIPVDVSIGGKAELPVEVKLAFYRIAQEALNNVAKHARASQVRMQLHLQPGKVELIIEDDGGGFDPNALPPGHLGLGIMKERAESIAASLRVDSRIGKGTQVLMTWQEENGSQGG